MKIVIATGIYPPDVGGPSYYAQGLAEALRRKGRSAELAVFSGYLKYPTGLRHILYARHVLRAARGADCVLALDTFSVALPALFASRLRGIPLFIRTGGDFLWERYLERTRDLLPLALFYEKHRRLTLKEKAIRFITGLIARRAQMIFSTELQEKLWIREYGIDRKNAHRVDNAVDPPLEPLPSEKKNFLWHVRPIVMKNPGNVRAAFAEAKAKHPDIVLEEGLLPKAELLERMRSCYAVILPSLTEISPNYVLDALRFKKPFILDKYSGFAEWLSPYGLFVDPLDPSDIARAIEELATPEGYARALRKAAAFEYVRTYDDVARDFLAIMLP